MEIFKGIEDCGGEEMKKYEQEIIEKYAHGRICDLGCGCGRCFPMLKEKGSYIGIDIRKEQIKEARKTYDPFFKVGDAMDMQFEDDTFDTIFCGFNVLDEVADLNKVLSEIRRTLKNKGTLIFSFHNSLNWKNFLRSRYTSWNSKRKVNIMTPFKIKKYLEDKGFKYLERYGSIFGPYPYYIFRVRK